MTPANLHLPHTEKVLSVHHSSKRSSLSLLSDRTRLRRFAFQRSVAREPRGLTEAQSSPADLFATAAVPGRSAALDVCVASSNAAAARGDAAPAAFDRKILHYRREIPDLPAQGIVYRPLLWTADGRPHRAVTRTLQCAADIAACRKNPSSTDGSTKSS